MGMKFLKVPVPDRPFRTSLLKAVLLSLAMTALMGRPLYLSLIHISEPTRPY